jgi:asparagine synthase (glutamine-hydrolysing)
MVADVPVGVLLSGGLDSSLLVAILTNRGQTGLKTFSIGFEDVGDVEGNEFEYSDLIAQRFGTEHYRIRVDAEAALSALPGTIAAMAEPMMSHDAVGFYLLSRDVSKHVKVVQSGQGADEVFGGYHWYRPLRHSNDLTEDYAKVYFDRDHAEMNEALHPSRLNGDYSREFVEQFFAQCHGSPVEKALQLDTQIMLVDDPVKRVDNMTMAWGLEGRVPFLDHELVELAARIPADLKIRGGGGKYILKEAARGLVPDAVIDRPKGYFPVPALKYLRGPFHEFVQDILTSHRARERELFDPAYVERLLADRKGDLTPKGHSKLWQLAVMEQWLQTHGI